MPHSRHPIFWPLIWLTFGGLIFGIGWLVGLGLLWTSELWTRGEKLLGTLVLPGGIALPLYLNLRAPRPHPLWAVVDICAFIAVIITPLYLGRVARQR